MPDEYSKRFCPKCKAELSELDRYFCSHCGGQLPPEIAYPKKAEPDSVEPFYTEEKPSNSSRLKSFSAKDFLRNFDRRLIIEILVVIVAVSLVYYLKRFFKISFPMNSGSNVSLTPTPETTQSNYLDDYSSTSLKADLNLDSGDLDHSLAVYVPSDVGLYIESYDLSAFQVVVPDLPNLFDYFEGPFVAFSLNIDGVNYWGILSKVRGLEQEEGLSRFLFEGWNYKVVKDDVVVFFNHEEIHERVERASLNVEKNITLNSHFVKSLGNISKTGSVLVVFQNFEGRKSLESIKDMAESMEDSTNVIELLDDILNFSYNELVIR